MAKLPTAHKSMKSISPIDTKYVGAKNVCLLDTARKPNAFDWNGPAVRIAATRVSKKEATRVNREASLADFVPSSVKAPR
jgi:hypothetical protein